MLSNEQITKLKSAIMQASALAKEGAIVNFSLDSIHVTPTQFDAFKAVLMPSAEKKLECASNGNVHINSYDEAGFNLCAVAS